MTGYSSSRQDFLVPVSAPVSSKQGFKTTDWLQLKQTDILLNRQRIVHSRDTRVGWPWRSGRDPAWLPFFTPSSPLGSALCKMQMGIHSRPVREGGMSGHMQNGAVTCSSTWEFWLAVASYITGSIVHVFPIIQSVIIRCLYVLNIYEPFKGSWLPKVTSGQSCASRGHVPELEKPLWLICIHCVPRVHLPGVGKVSVVIFVAYLWALLGVSGVEFRDQLASFSARPPLVAHA